MRGLVIACHNMIEEPLFDRPAFRAACAADDLGIVMIFSGHDHLGSDDSANKTPERSYLDIFLNPYYGKGGTGVADEDAGKAGQDLQKVLDALADESGYPEIRYAPLLPVGHSSAGSFVWHLYKWDASRIFAMMPFKTGTKDDGPQGIPIMDFNSEYFDFGKEANNVGTLPRDLQGALNGRKPGPEALYGYYVDIGEGHCDASDDAIPMMALFLKKAVAARIPVDAPVDAPVRLKPVTASSGVLMDAASFLKPDAVAVPYNQYTGDRTKAFWYLDQELADAAHAHTLGQLAKKPQRLGFIVNGQTLDNAGMQRITPTFLDDMGTFKLQADFLDHVTQTDLYPTDTVYSYGPEPIQYRVNPGSSVVQVGPDTFRICPRWGPLAAQGIPWAPTVLALVPGDDEFQPYAHPITIWVSPIATDGAPQTLTFTPIPDQKSDNLQPIALSATTSANLPVQFYMVSGPADIEGNTLTFTQIPAKAKFPIRVLVAAYQFGHRQDPKIQSAGPVMQQFFIQK